MPPGPRRERSMLPPPPGVGVVCSLPNEGQGAEEAVYPPTPHRGRKERLNCEEHGDEAILYADQSLKEMIKAQLSERHKWHHAPAGGQGGAIRLSSFDFRLKLKSGSFINE